MDVLATFPTVMAVPAPGRRKDSVTRAAARPRKSPAVVVLALVAAGTWTAAWLLERQRDEARQSATMAVTAARELPSVTR